MNILLVNDDGIASGALRVLCRALASRGHRVTVCAPAGQQSAKSHCFTINTPVQVAERHDVEGATAAWAIDGTPADCTRIGLMDLCEGPVDLVISGINYGYNAGLAVYVSGTVGAAREAAFQRKPSLALSMHYDTTEEALRFFAEWSVTVAERLVGYGRRPELSVCNINMPGCAVHEVQTPVMCPLSRNVYNDSYERRVSPRGQIYYWLHPETPDDRPTPGSDVDLLNKNHITCTFLGPEPLEQTQYADFLEEL